MLEGIRTFLGRLRGLHGADRRIIVEEGRIWRCTKCSMLFLSKVSGEEHSCTEVEAR